MVTKWESASLTFCSNQFGIYMLVGSTQLTSTCSRLHCLQNSSKILLYTNMSLEWGPGSCPRAALLFLLTVSPLFLPPLPSLISICLNLPVGTQGKSWSWMKPISYNQKVVDTERLLCPGTPKVPTQFLYHLEFQNSFTLVVVNVHLGSWNLSNVSPNKSSVLYHFLMQIFYLESSVLVILLKKKTKNLCQILLVCKWI